MKRWAGILAFLGAIALTIAPATAHAVLEASSPSAGESVAHSPQAVTLTFDEPVETTVGSLRVLDANGSLRSTGAIVHPSDNAARIAVRVGNLENGRYSVAWKVVSADSHIVDGAFAFGVGVPAGAAPEPAAADAAGAVLLPIVHFGIFAGALLAIGLPFGAATVGRRANRRPNFVEFGAWFVLAFCAFADAALRADLAGGSIASALTTHVGVLRLVTIGAALAGIVAISRRERWWDLLIAACAVVTVSLSLAGHAAGGDVPVLGFIADALHLFGAAAWIGLLAIATTLEPGEDLRGISPIAIGAVCAIVLTGIVQTVRNVGSVTALLTTSYGHDILIKIALMILALGVALLSRRALARNRFAIGHWLKLELWLLTAVIAVTAVLVESALPRESPVRITTATASFTVRDISVHVTATSSGQRQWAFHVDGTDARGGVLPLDNVTVSVSEASRNWGPLAIPMARTREASFTGAVTLPFDGEWSALVSVRSGDFDENHTTIQLKESTP